MSSSALVFALALAVAAPGCAVTPQFLPEPPPPHERPALPESPRPEIPPPGPDGREVRGADALVRLCEALRDEDAMPFSGSEVQQARAREAHGQRRMAAVEEGYVVVVPSGGFGFRRYELDERRLVIDTDRPFVLAQGVELAAVDVNAPLAFELAPEAAETVLRDHAAGRLAARLVFKPAPSDLNRDGCARASGGRIIKLPARVMSYVLARADGTALASGSTELAHEMGATSPVRTPEITLGRPRTADGREASDAVSASLRQLGPALLPCYDKALAARPNLRGTLVMDLRFTGDGRVESSRTEMSTVRDDGLASCATAQLTKTRLPGITAPLRLSVPITFGGKEDR